MMFCDLYFSNSNPDAVLFNDIDHSILNNPHKFINVIYDHRGDMMGAPFIRNVLYSSYLPNCDEMSDNVKPQPKSLLHAYRYILQLNQLIDYGRIIYPFRKSDLEYLQLIKHGKVSNLQACRDMHVLFQRVNIDTIKEWQYTGSVDQIEKLVFSYY